MKIEPLDKLNLSALVHLVDASIEEERIFQAVERAEMLLKLLKKIRDTADQKPRRLPESK